MPRQQHKRPSWVRYSGMGVEIAAAIGGFVLLGYWIDHHWGTNPWGVVVGLVLGLVGGMYNLVRESFAAIRDSNREDGNEE